MSHRTLPALLGLTLAACATQQHNTREVLQRVDNRFFRQEQCKPTSTGSLTREQVTGLDELPSALRESVLANLPLQAEGSTERVRCEDVAARLLEKRLHSLCWVEARVTAQPQLSVQLGARYQVGTIIWVTQEKDAKVPPARIIEAAKSALPKDKACTTKTLEKIREQVSKLGSFHQVLVESGPADSEQKQVTLLIDVKETAPAPPKEQAPADPNKK
ncbi:hypothetical protein JQX13_30270 [Archangium violaceum]|uniref:hypothetical protein n=1 Tax=Archangium violaceum TaxID=83451 RepID=UPI00193BB7BC|nr:hypothetical protein [Archangium violaceum]QRK04531.1 hypothetical protein JQX13_30270 [Archangium violaceum]